MQRRGGIVARSLIVELVDLGIGEGFAHAARCLPSRPLQPRRMGAGSLTLHLPTPGKFRFVVDEPDQSSRRDSWLDGPDLRTMLRKLWMRRNGLLRLSLTGLAVGLALAVVALMVRAPGYRASSEMLVSYTSLQLSGQDAAVTQMLVDGSIVQSQIELVRSNSVLGRTVARLGAQTIFDLSQRTSPLADIRAVVAAPVRWLLPPAAAPAASPKRDQEAISVLRSLLTIRRLGASQIISISATGGSPQAAADIANAVAQDFMEEQREINALVTTSGVMRDRIRSIGPTLRLVSQAMPPSGASGPGMPVLLLLGGLVGAMTAAAAGALRVLLDSRIILPRQLTIATGLECFGSLPRLGETIPQGSLTFRPGRDPAKATHQPAILINVLRQARAAIVERASPGPRFVGVTSYADDEGTSTVAFGLAHLLASEGQRVLLVDAAASGQELTRWLAPSANTGLGEALRDPRRFGDVVKSEVRPNLDFLPGRGHGSDLDDCWGRFGRDWRPHDGREYDWCIFDLPTLNPSIDIRVAGATMDRLILVTQWGRVPAAALEESLVALGPVRHRIAGAIINLAPPHALGADAFGWRLVA
jgi:Mrp family chromosome partitioning ATPase/capsular polysaccharide biosynthesis protein